MITAALALFLMILALLLAASCTPAAPQVSLAPAPSLTPVFTATPAYTPTLAFSATPSATSPIEAGWKLVWNDEFDGPAGSRPDPDKWTYDIGWGANGWGNAEWESYTSSPENAALDGKGALAITAKKTDPASNTLLCGYGECLYTSARLLSKGLYQLTYGRIEARIKIPFGQGIWPAFWMLGADIDTNSWPACGEIDILENIGKEPATIHATVHGPGYSGANGVGGPFFLPSGRFADDFHVYAVEWEKDTLRWYMDGSQYLTVTPDQLPGRWVFDHPFFILLNLAVGGYWPGYPDDTTPFPQTLHVDYVRVYQR